MDWLIVHKEALEVLSYISVIIGGVAAVFAALQIYYAKESVKMAASSLELAKKDSHIKLKREAIMVAAEKCEQYAKEIIPLVDKCLNSMETFGVTTKPWQLVNNLLNETSIRDWDAANQWFDKLCNTNADSKVIEVLNLLESFAIYFVKGAADEQVAYPSISIPFRDCVEIMSPYLIKVRQNKIDGQASGDFHNVAALYALWSDRSNKESLQIESNKITEKLSQIHTSEMPPIGLEK